MPGKARSGYQSALSFSNQLHQDPEYSADHSNIAIDKSKACQEAVNLAEDRASSASHKWSYGACTKLLDIITKS